MNKGAVNILIFLFLLLFTKISAQNISEKERDSVLSKVMEKLNVIYPFPEISEKTIVGLKSKITEGYFKNYYSSSEFAVQVTAILEKYSNDKHLDLIFDPNLAKALLKETLGGGNYTKEEANSEIWNNYGFKKLEILDGNIGYLNLSVFFSTDYARELADASMSYFKNCKSLVIDLRQNGGGWGDMVVYLLSYFVNNDKPLLLDITESTIDKSADSTIVPKNSSLNKPADIPVYILVSSATASAAEAFTFYMKRLNKSAITIGKKTKGAENPVEHVAINNNFVLQIPAWKRIYSMYPGSWEGVGINPDIEIETADALLVAHKIALEKLSANANDKTAVDKYKWALDGISASYDNIDKNTFNKYSGDYDKMKIFLDDGKLYYKAGDESAKLLIPINENYFVIEGVDYFRIKFIVNSKGILLKKIYTYGNEREYLKNEK